MGTDLYPVAEVDLLVRQTVPCRFPCSGFVTASVVIAKRPHGSLKQQSKYNYGYFCSFALASAVLRTPATARMNGPGC